MCSEVVTGVSGASFWRVLRLVAGRFILKLFLLADNVAFPLDFALKVVDGLQFLLNFIGFPDSSLASVYRMRNDIQLIFGAN
jgi:hypothetical protein